ncbi:prolyl hydroxylase family protein [Alteraurantiacibacter aquimixticola]|uniref:2OG-Fe(II) oxygenase n=1 Tax=Alteraurantiacibacter aquimixticola TaxID=2489173 RepID=A0A4V4U8Y5_9SPHN|nr:2OG-Fe(II) oxygenase [Alteraurantiacibacter aquimixticola]TIX51877.1 2OG-Fe(II) oxygenase [Alteraurantiacibacter aquimixticola]
MAVKTKPEFLKDQPRLRRVGAEVRERLAANPAVWQVPTDKAEIYAVADFIKPEECDRLIAMIDDVAKPSTVFDIDYSEGYRTSYSGDVDPTDPFIRKLNRRLNDLMGVYPEWGETIQGQRYLPGQEFKPHHDWFHPNTSYWDFEMGRGGQRAYTAMAFLNDVEEGGTTDFTDLEMSIEPKPGALLLWNNADKDGLPNPHTIHAGRPVVKGVKYIFTKWYRAQKWN